MENSEGKTAEPRLIALEDCEVHTNADSCWIGLFGKVYDVTKFLDEHPGGDDVILQHSGTDATEPFEEIGHSSAAVEMLDKYEIGILKDSAGGKKAGRKKDRGATFPVSQSTGLRKVVQVLMPVILLALALFLSFTNKKEKDEL